MVDGVVDAEEAVVGAVERGNGDGAVLGDVLGDVELQLSQDGFDVHLCFDDILAFVDKVEYGVVDMVVEQDDAMLSGTYEVRKESVGIEKMNDEEDALLRLLSDEGQLEHPVDTLVDDYLMLFEGVETLEDASFGYEKGEHGDKGIHFLYADINCCFAVQNGGKHGRTMLGI